MADNNAIKRTHVRNPSPYVFLGLGLRTLSLQAVGFLLAK